MIAVAVDKDISLVSMEKRIGKKREIERNLEVGVEKNEARGETTK